MTTSINLNNYAFNSHASQIAGRVAKAQDHLANVPEGNSVTVTGTKTRKDGATVEYSYTLTNNPGDNDSVSGTKNITTTDGKHITKTGSANFSDTGFTADVSRSNIDTGEFSSATLSQTQSDTGGQINYSQTNANGKQKTYNVNVVV